MRFISLLPLCAIFHFAGVLNAQVLFFDFNKISGSPPTESLSSGSAKIKEVNKERVDLAEKKPKKFKSKGGEGVTGQSNDYALDLREATIMGNDGTGGAGIVSEAAKAMAGFQSFTFCGWYRVESPEGNGARLLEMWNQETQGFFLALTEGNLSFELNKRRVVSSSLDYKVTNQWVFFAVSYDGTATANQLTFYQGTKKGGLTSQTADLIVETPLPQDGGSLSIGNSGGFERPLKGLMDNVAIYGSASDASGALTKPAIEKIFQDTAILMKPGT